jgi:uncharacterized protein YegP (UPF0339 family)
MNYIKAFFKWLFKNDYVDPLASNWVFDDTDYLVKSCDVPSPVLEDDTDHEFYELTDPKGCRIELYKDRKKEWRWRFFSANNKILACSGEGYKRKGSMKKSLNIVREILPFAPVEEE